MMIEPSLLRTLFVCFLAIACHRNQDDFTEFKFLANFPGYLEAVHPRQPDIQQDQIRAVVTGRFQGRETVVRRL